MFPNTDIVHHFHPIAWVRQMKLLEKQTGKCFCTRDFTADDVKKIVKTITTKEEIWTGLNENCSIKDKSFETLTDELNKMFKKYSINECIQKIAFLAQVSAETGMFKQTIEEKSRYLSSQSTYKGRGIIQLTGTADDTKYYKPGAYKNYADYINDQSIISNPNKKGEVLWSDAKKSYSSEAKFIEELENILSVAVKWGFNKNYAYKKDIKNTTGKATAVHQNHFHLGLR